MAIPVSKILHFPAGTRLSCPNCGLTSNNHKSHSPRTEYYWDTKCGPSNVCLHTCKACGYTDNEGGGFTDSGNDESDDFRRIPEWEKELAELEDDIADLKDKIQKGKDLFTARWLSDEDYRN